MRYFRDNISISTSITFSGYLDTDIMRYVEWYRDDTTCKYTPQVDYHKVSRVCSFESRDISLKQNHQYTNWPQKAPRSCVLRITLLGCMNAHQFDTRGRQGRKLNSEHWLFSRLERRSGEGRGVRAMWPRIWGTKWREIDNVMRRKYA